MRPLLQTIVSKYGKDQRCSNLVGLDTGGIIFCDGSICPVLNAKLLAKEASSDPALHSQWLYVNNISPTFPSDQDPAWMDIKEYIWDASLFPALNKLGYEEQDAKIETMSKWFLSTGLVAFEEPDLALNLYTAVPSDYTCSGQLSVQPTTTSKCPKWSATFTSPSKVVSTFVCPGTFLVEDDKG